MNEIYKFILPSFIILPRKTKEDRKVYLNLNVYRNLHHHINNAIKTAFWPELGYDTFKADAITISYVIEKKSIRKFDTMNIVSVVDKFFCDWLVMEGFIPDDTCDIVSYGSMIGWTGCHADKITAIVKVIKDDTPKAEQKNLFCT